MKPFASLKEARKGLKLPGGQDAEVFEYTDEDGNDDSSYSWSKKGGYADKVFAKLLESLKKAGWKLNKDTHSGTPDGYHDTFGTHYVKQGWCLSYSKHYGAWRYDNWFSIKLKRIDA